MLTLLLIGVVIFLITRWLWPTIKPQELRKPDTKQFSKEDKDD